MIPYRWVKASMGGRPSGRGAGRSREPGALGERGSQGRTSRGRQRRGGPWRRVLERGRGCHGGLQCVDRGWEGRLSVMLQGTCTQRSGSELGWVCLIDVDEAPSEGRPPCRGRELNGQLRDGPWTQREDPSCVLVFSARSCTSITKGKRPWLVFGYRGKWQPGGWQPAVEAEASPGRVFQLRWSHSMQGRVGTGRLSPLSLRGAH